MRHERFIALLLTAITSLFFLAAKGQAASRTKTDEVISTSGGPVSFPGGITLPTAANGDTFASTAALTLAAGTNVAAVVTPVTLKYTKIGNHVHVFGQVSIDPTAGATASTFTLTLPVARANFTGTSGATGWAGILGGTAGACLATNSAQTVTCNYVSGGTAVELVPVDFWYTTSGN